jgi:hypothetical protein
MLRERRNRSESLVRLGVVGADDRRPTRAMRIAEVYRRYALEFATEYDARPCAFRLLAQYIGSLWQRPDQMR